MPDIELAAHAAGGDGDEDRIPEQTADAMFLAGVITLEEAVTMLCDEWVSPAHTSPTSLSNAQGRAVTARDREHFRRMLRRMQAMQQQSEADAATIGRKDDTIAQRDQEIRDLRRDVSRANIRAGDAETAATNGRFYAQIALVTFAQIASRIGGTARGAAITDAAITLVIGGTTCVLSFDDGLNLAISAATDGETESYACATHLHGLDPRILDKIAAVFGPGTPPGRLLYPDALDALTGGMVPDLVYAGRDGDLIKHLLASGTSVYIVALSITDTMSGRGDEPPQGGGQSRRHPAGDPWPAGGARSAGFWHGFGG